MELPENGLHKLVDGIKLAEEGVKEMERLQIEHAEEKETQQTEKAEQKRKLTKNQKWLRRMKN